LRAGHIREIQYLEWLANVVLVKKANGKWRMCDENKKYIKMTKDAILEGSSQQANKEAINRRNGQGPQYLKFFLLVFLIWRPKPTLRPKPTRDHPSCLRRY